MNVFTTKDGKVYKVSLKNFVKATNKKAPYYRRVKIKGKVVEKAYAICPGCGNPVHFVNLFNKSKKKKAHVRHQRSSIKGLAKYNALAYKNCPFVKSDAETISASGKSQKINIVPKAFIGAMVSAFGFSEEVAKFLGLIYYKLKRKYPNVAEQKFFAYMASVSYNNTTLWGIITGKDSGSIKDIAMGEVWNSIAGIKLDADTKHAIRLLGFGEDDTEGLFAQIDDQHKSLDNPERPYFGKVDFTHFCATTAAILSNSTDKAIGDFASGAFDGIPSTDAHSGYIGDLCGTDGAGPSMNDGDYKADLDAVNVATIIKKNPSISLMQVMSGYFGGLESKDINRAYEFGKNIGMENLKAQRDAYASHLEQKDAVLFDKFIECVEQGKEEWPSE